MQAALGSLAEGRVSALTKQDDAAQPSIVYRQVGTKPGEVEGYVVTQTDEFVVTLRHNHNEWEQLLALVNSVNAQIAAAPLAMRLEDIVFGWDDEQECYRSDVAVNVNYSAGQTGHASAQSTALVWWRGRSASELEDSYVATQTLTNEYSICLSTTGDIEALRDAVMVALLGKDLRSTGFDMFYVEGKHLDISGDLKVCQEIYADREVVEEQT